MNPSHEKTIELSGGGKWLSWGSTTLYTVFGVFSIISFSVLAESIEVGTGLDSKVITSTATLYFLVYAFAQLIAGILIDRRGIWPTMVGTSALATAGGFLFMCSDSASILHLARAMMGAGLASGFVGALYIARTRFPAKNFAFMSGITQMAANLIAAFASAAIAEMDFTPVIMISSIINGILTIILAVTLLGSPRPTQSSPSRSGSLTTSAAILTMPSIWIASLFFAGMFGSFLVFADFWNIPLQKAHGHDIQLQANLNAMLPLGTAFGAMLIGLWSDRSKKVSALACLASIASTGLLSVVIFLPPTSTAGMATVLLATGFCLGGAILAFPSATINCPPHLHGAAIGLVTTFGFVAAGVANFCIGELAAAEPAISEMMKDHVHTDTPYQNAIAGFKTAFIPMLALAALSIPCSFLMHGKASARDR